MLYIMGAGLIIVITIIGILFNMRKQLLISIISLEALVIEAHIFLVSGLILYNQYDLLLTFLMFSALTAGESALIILLFLTI